MKKTTIVAAAALVAVTTAGTATAGTHQRASSTTDVNNTMTFREWYDVQGPGETQANVEAPEGGATSVGNIGCGCTGTKVKTWTGADGNDRKWVQYDDTEKNSSVIQYRLGDGGHWKTDGLKIWQTDETGESFFYGVPTF